jgi:RNA polymerase sigma factor (sigma-70 family)
MTGIRSDRRAERFRADLEVWSRESAADNSRQLRRALELLRRAREEKLTPCQRRALELYYDRGMTMEEVGAELGVHRTTVSRTLRRARQRLRECLRYSL